MGSALPPIPQFHGSVVMYGYTCGRPCVYLVLDKLQYYVDAMFTFRLHVTMQVYFSQTCSSVGISAANMSHAS